MDNQLLVKIATDTSQLRSQLDQATGVITGFSSSVKSALGGMLAGLSVGGAAAYFTSITKGAIEAGDRIGELSQITGVSVKTLSGLQVAAKTSGIDLETLASTLGKMSKNLTGVEEPGSNAARALDALGINAEKFKSAKVEDRLFILADALEGVDNSGGQASAAMDTLVKGGSALIPMLSGGSEKLREMIGVAESLGLVLTEETAASMDAVADTMTIMGMQGQGLGNVIATALAPTLEGLSKLWLDNAKEGGKFSEMIGTVLTGAVKAAVSAVATGITVFKQFGSLLAGTIAGIVQAVQGNFTGAIEAVKAGFEDATKAGEDNADFLQKLWKDELPKFSDEEKKAAAAINLRTAAQVKGTEASRAARDAAKELKEQQDEILRLAKEEAEADLKLQEALQKITDERVKSIAAAMKEVESLQEANRQRQAENEEIGLTKEAVAELRIARLDEAIAAQTALLDTIELEEAERKVIELKIAALKEARSLALDRSTREALVEQANAASAAWKQTATQIEQALTDALVEGFNSGKSVVKSIGEYIVNYFKTTIAKGIAQALMGALGAGISGVAGAVGIGGGSSGAGGIGIGDLASIGSLFAGGGIGSFGLTGLMSTLTGTGLGTSLGAAGSLLTGGNIAGGLGMGLGALAPYAAAAFALYSIFQKKSSPATQEFGFVNAAGMDVSAEGFYNAVVKQGGVDADLTAMAQGIAGTVRQLVADLGGTLNDQLRFGLFTSTSPDNKGAQTVANVTTPGGDLFTYNVNAANETVAARLASVVPSMIAAALKASEFPPEIKAIFDGLGASVTESQLAAALEQAATEFERLNPAVEEAAESLDETATAVDEAAEAAKRWAETIAGKVDHAWDLFATETMQFDRDVAKVTQGFSALNLELPKTGEEFIALLDAIIPSVEYTAEFKDSLVALIDPFARVIEAQQKLAEAADDTSEAVEASGEAVKQTAAGLWASFTGSAPRTRGVYPGEPPWLDTTTGGMPDYQKEWTNALAAGIANRTFISDSTLAFTSPEKIAEIYPSFGGQRTIGGSVYDLWMKTDAGYTSNAYNLGLLAAYVNSRGGGASSSDDASRVALNVQQTMAAPQPNALLSSTPV